MDRRTQRQLLITCCIGERAKKKDFANFAIIVLSGQWELNWDESVRRHFEEGVAAIVKVGC